MHERIIPGASGSTHENGHLPLASHLPYSQERLSEEARTVVAALDAEPMPLVKKQAALVFWELATRGEELKDAATRLGIAEDQIASHSHTLRHSFTDQEWTVLEVVIDSIGSDKDLPPVEDYAIEEKNTFSPTPISLPRGASEKPDGVATPTEEELIEYRERGFSHKEIAEKYHLKPNYIKACYRRLLHKGRIEEIRRGTRSHRKPNHYRESMTQKAVTTQS